MAAEYPLTPYTLNPQDESFDGPPQAGIAQARDYNKHDDEIQAISNDLRAAFQTEITNIVPATVASWTNGEITITSVAPGAIGNSRTIQFIDPSAVNVPLSVATGVSSVTVTLGTDGTGAITSTWSDVDTAITNNVAASALISADSNSATVASPTGVISLTGGINSIITYAENIEEAIVNIRDDVNTASSDIAGINADLATKADLSGGVVLASQMNVQVSGPYIGGAGSTGSPLTVSIPVVNTAIDFEADGLITWEEQARLTAIQNGAEVNAARNASIVNGDLVEALPSSFARVYSKKAGSNLVFKRLVSNNSFLTIADGPVNTDDVEFSVTTNSGTGLVQLTGGKIDASLLPDSVTGSMEYKGALNPNTDPLPTPTEAGHFYIISADGSYDLNSNTSIQADENLFTGDWIVWSGTKWDVIDNRGKVHSVNGNTGAVTITAADLGALTSVAVGSGLSGTGVVGSPLVVDFSSRAALVHSHVVSDVTGLQAALDAKSNTNHGHALGTGHIFTDSQASWTSNILRINNAAIETFSDAGTYGVVLGGDSRLSDSRTPLAHTHAITDVTNLQSVLSGKANTTHTHSASTDITGLTDYVYTEIKNTVGATNGLSSYQLFNNGDKDLIISGPTFAGGSGVSITSATSTESVPNVGTLPGGWPTTYTKTTYTVGVNRDVIVYDYSKTMLIAANPITLTTNDGAKTITVGFNSASIDHDAITNFVITKHRVHDDAQTTTTTLWSSQKTQDLLNLKLNANEKAAANGVAPLDGSTKLDSSYLTFGTTSGTVAQGNDSRFVNARAWNGSIVLPGVVTLADARSNLGVYSTTQVDSALGGKINVSEKGANGGVATLGSDGTIPLSQFPSTIAGALDYKGTWNPNNSLDPGYPWASEPLTKGDYYIASASKSDYDFSTTSQVLDIEMGDWVIYNGAAWEILSQAEVSVTSINGQSGVVVLSPADFGLTGVTPGAQLLISQNLNDLNSKPTARTNLDVYSKTETGTAITAAIDAITTSVVEEGSNLYYTNERVDDRVAALLVAGSGVTLTYEDNNTNPDSLTIAVDHDTAANFIANEHVDHTTVSITVDTWGGLFGGGDISASRTFKLDVNNLQVAGDVTTLDYFPLYDQSANATYKTSCASLRSFLYSGGLDLNLSAPTTTPLPYNTSSYKTIFNTRYNDGIGGTGTPGFEIFSRSLNTSGGFEWVVRNTSTASDAILVNGTDNLVKIINNLEVTGASNFNGTATVSGSTDYLLNVVQSNTSARTNMRVGTSTTQMLFRTDSSVSNNVILDTLQSGGVFAIYRNGTGAITIDTGNVDTHATKVLNVLNITDSTSSTSTAALKVVGGASIAKSLSVGDTVRLATNGLGTSGSPNLLLGSAITGPQIQAWQAEGATTQNLYLGMGGIQFLRLDYSAARTPVRLVSLVDGVGITGFETSLSSSTTKVPTSSAVTSAVGACVLKAGDTMTGALSLSSTTQYAPTYVKFYNSVEANISGGLAWHKADGTTLTWDFYQNHASSSSQTVEFYDNTAGGGTALAMFNNPRKIEFGSAWDVKVLSTTPSNSPASGSFTTLGGMGIGGDTYLAGNLAQIRGINYTWPNASPTQYSILRSYDASGTLEWYAPVEQWVTSTPTPNGAGLQTQMYFDGTYFHIHVGTQWIKMMAVRSW